MNFVSFYLNNVARRTISFAATLAHCGPGYANKVLQSFFLGVRDSDVSAGPDRWHHRHIHVRPPGQNVSIFYIGQ
jgi:hypothetical protein